eukprot:TRINITY_DN28370_c0_g1_i1.p1 TRINITY_DN28370_c0_g1~~TRINITY_DN28370_c0_g1_i1.p1  ORF type:complete len:464 (+),score=76.55 TRINITY_DN28370_c0_g1_i1:54-1445(+)
MKPIIRLPSSSSARKAVSQNQVKPPSSRLYPAPRLQQPLTSRTPVERGRRRSRKKKVMCPAGCTCRAHAYEQPLQHPSLNLIVHEGSLLSDQEFTQSDFVQDDKRSVSAMSSRYREPLDQSGRHTAPPGGTTSRRAPPLSGRHSVTPTDATGRSSVMTERSQRANSRQSIMTPTQGWQSKARIRTPSFFVMPSRWREQDVAHLEDEHHQEHSAVSALLKRDGGFADLRSGFAPQVLANANSGAGHATELFGKVASMFENGHPSTGFDAVVSLSKKHGMPIREVRAWAEKFRELDYDGSGEMSLIEFEEAVRKICQIKENEPLPRAMMAALMQQADKDGNGSICFEEYILWSQQCTFVEEMAVNSAQERDFRALARELGVNLPEIEKLKSLFNSFDTDGSGFIDEAEFGAVTLQLMHVKDFTDIPENRVRRFWQMAAKGESSLSFQDFLRWYLSNSVSEELMHI